MIRRNPRTIIGQAWTGRHVILLHCYENNTVQQLFKSFHAPMEPPRQNCAETLSQLISIGYSISHVTSLPGNQIQYMLVL